MIKNLQKRFIIVCMAAVCSVVLIIMSVLHLSSYSQIVRDANHTLDILEQNGGFFPKPEKPGGKGYENTKTIPEQLKAEAPYQTRFFTVTLSEKGTAASVNTGSVAAVITEEAIALAEVVYQSSKAEGFKGVYYYRITDLRGDKLVLFLDCSRDLNFMFSYLRSSLLVSIAMILGVFLIVLLCSKKAIRPMVESYERQKYFITNASHELKTPLSVILANTEVLEMLQEENEWTKSIKHQINRLTELTNSMVMLSRMEEENKIMMNPFSLSGAFNDVSHDFEAAASQNGLRVLQQIEEDIIYTGDEKSIRQLIGIVYENAMKYADKGSEISCRLTKKGKNIEFCVKNVVKGMKKGDYAVFFDRFYRQEKSRNKEIEGYGIGLSAAKAIVDSHKGKIEAKSERDNEFFIRVIL